MGNDTAVCPRCGNAMLRRLDEFECSACGHFQSIRLSSGAVSGSLAGSQARRVFDSSAEEVTAAAKLPVVSHRLTEALFLQRRLFLIAFALLFFGMNCAALSRGAQTPLDSATVLRLAIATVFWGVVIAAVLYVDWPLLKKCALALLVLALAWLGYETLGAAAPGEQMRQIAAGSTFLLLLWLGFILWLDLRINA